MNIEENNELEDSNYNSIQLVALISRQVYVATGGYL
jgi:hypothetical protein